MYAHFVIFLSLNILPPILNPFDVTLELLKMVKNGPCNLNIFYIYKKSKQNLRNEWHKTQKRRAR
jgi:hypothetical protein